MNKYILTILCLFFVPIYSAFAEINYSDKSQHILYDRGKWQREVPIGKIGDCYEGFAYGYTQIKDGRCYNPQTYLSYEKSACNNPFYYYKGTYCGKGCDFNGRNCKEGICNFIL